MHIKRKQLIDTVVIPGSDFLGNDSVITFNPSDKPGWYWNTKYSGIIPIDHRIARYKKGRIQLFSPGENINVWEHLGLRFAGIDNVEVSMDFNDWPPYLTAGQYLKYFEGKTKETGEYIPTISVKNEYERFYTNRLLSEVQIKKNESFSLYVLSQWEDLPQRGISLREEDIFEENFLKNVFGAKSQGLSHRKIFAKILSAFGWPHMKNVSWKSDFDNKNDASYAWWLHALQDALGEISLASHVALPVGSFYRFKAGHKQMLEGIQKAFA